MMFLDFINRLGKPAGGKVLEIVGKNIKKYMCNIGKVCTPLISIVKMPVQIIRVLNF